MRRLALALRAIFLYEPKKGMLLLNMIIKPYNNEEHILLQTPLDREELRN